MKKSLIISFLILAIASTYCYAIPDAEECQKASESGIILYDCQDHTNMPIIIYNENVIVINPDISKHKHKEKHICKDTDCYIYKHMDNHIQGKGKR